MAWLKQVRQDLGNYLTQARHSIKDHVHDISYCVSSCLPFSHIRSKIPSRMLTQVKKMLLTLQLPWLAEQASNQRSNSTSDLLFW
jgi:hypothetical protein